MFSFFKKKQEIIEQKEEFASNEPTLLLVSFFFKEKPMLERTKLLNALSKRFKQVEGEDLIFCFPEYLNQFADGSVPAQAVIVESDERGINQSKYETAFQQCWHWEEAKDTLLECEYQFSIADIMSRGLDYKKRLEYFQKVIDSIVEATKPQVLYFQSSDKLIEPIEYLERDEDDLYAFMNVRLFNITNEESGKVLMDTVGLHAFGLVDWQFRFDDYSPNAIAELLTNYAYYTFENGNVINDGNTIQGIEASDKWVCSFEDAIIEPMRGVMDVVVD